MLYDFDIYSHPEALSEVKNELAYLHAQIKIIEGLEHARNRIGKIKSLDSNTLSKCDVFVGRINHDTPDDDFDLEVRKLSLNELAFCSISFEGRRLKSVTPWFKASNIRTYMEKTKVTCLDRPEIFTRIKRLSAISTVKRFHDIYTAAYDLHEISKHPNPTELDDQMEDTLSTSEPATTAKQPGAFEFPGMSWTNIEKVFPPQIATAIRQVPPRINDSNVTDCVRSRFPRVQEHGDAFIWLDLESVEIQPLLSGSGPGIEADQIEKVFGDTISNAIDESDLRKWEKKNGRIGRTECVKVKKLCHVELRIGFDTNIANVLFN